MTTPEPLLRRTGDDEFSVDGVSFSYTFRAGSTPDHFHLRKPYGLADAFARLVAEHDDANIVELGIAHGGSTALAALVGRFRRLVAVELAPDPVPALEELISSRGLGDRVRTFHGVNQDDRSRLSGIVDAEFGDEPLDLVLDDASHRYAETRASFEVLFPRLRPGGAYLIEDWSCDQQMANEMYERRGGVEAVPGFVAGIEAVAADPTHPEHQRVVQALEAEITAALDAGPTRRAAEAREKLNGRIEAALADPAHPQHDQVTRLARGEAVAAPAPPPVAGDVPDRILLQLVLELVLVQVARPDIVSEIVLADPWWVFVRRGPASLDPSTFDVEDHFRDHFRVLR